MAFSTFTFRASGFFCEDGEVMEAQDSNLLGRKEAVSQPYQVTGYHSTADLISCIS
jgi:hypothetical protein